MDVRVGRVPLGRGEKLALDQAVACLQTAPDGAVTLIRKAVQIAITEATNAGSGWNKRLESLQTASKVTEEGVRAARRVNVLGDWGAHVPRGLPLSAAKECLEYGRIILSDLGFDVSGYGDDREFDRLLRYLRYLIGEAWQWPHEFGTYLSGTLEGGGFIDIVFACLSCGSEVLVEDVEIPPPVWVGGSIAESESEAGNACECPLCGSMYEILSTNSLVGWHVELEIYERSAGGGRLGNRQIAVSDVPLEGEFLHRVTFGGASDE